MPNYKEPDPDLGDLNLSRGGTYPVRYALRLAAGFGSQIAMSLLRWTPMPDGRRRAPDELGYAYRIVDRAAWQRWLDRRWPRRRAARGRPPPPARRRRRRPRHVAADSAVPVPYAGHWARRRSGRSRPPPTCRHPLPQRRNRSAPAARGRRSCASWRACAAEPAWMTCLLR